MEEGQTDPEQIWREFTEKLRNGEFSEADCRPILGTSFGFLVSKPEQKALRDSISRTSNPKWEYGEDKLIFRVPMGKHFELRLDFVVENGRWYLYFVDGVTIPVKKMEKLPFSDFPPLPEIEDWGRAEWKITTRVRFYLRLVKWKGKDEALKWFRDGKGYRVGSSAWMPYFSPPKAFVVYASWKEARLHGEDVYIEEFSDSRCQILFKNHKWFRMYDVATHLKPIITREEYRELFEDLWRDRGMRNGWQTSFSYENYDIRMMFERLA